MQTVAYGLHSGEKRSRRCRVSTIFAISPMIDTSQVGLATDKTKVPLLCVLEPFITWNGILITPSVHIPSHAIRTDETLGWSFWFWTIHFAWVEFYTRSELRPLTPGSSSLSSILPKSPSCSHIRSPRSCQRSHPFLRINRR